MGVFDTFSDTRRHFVTASDPNNCQIPQCLPNVHLFSEVLRICKCYELYYGLRPEKSRQTADWTQKQRRKSHLYCRELMPSCFIFSKHHNYFVICYASWTLLIINLEDLSCRIILIWTLHILGHNSIHFWTSPLVRKDFRGNKST